MIRWRLASRVTYGIFNGLLLLTLASKRAYRTNLWVAKEVVDELGAVLVNKGQPGLRALRSYPNNTYNDESLHRPRLVYNIDQVENCETVLGLSFPAVTPPKRGVLYRRSMQTKDWLTGNRSLAVVHSNRAAYHPSWDLVMMPPRELFEGEEGEANYWATFWHEVVHWTGHSERLNRERHRVWGDQRLSRRTASHIHSMSLQSTRTAALRPNPVTTCSIDIPRSRTTDGYSSRRTASYPLEPNSRPTGTPGSQFRGLGPWFVTRCPILRQRSFAAPLAYRAGPF